MESTMAEQLFTGSITLVVGMLVVFLVLGILYGMLLLIPLVNKKE
jgi:competence protein ComGC